MIDFKILDPNYPYDALGFLPYFADEADPRRVRDQFHDNYAHGGGWSSMAGWKLGPVGEIMYPGEPPLNPIAVGVIHDEVIRVYPYAWVSIAQPDGSFEVARMD